ncbi:hypothetical protein SCLCIDRAFT_1213983 [Scleroderma citrinum Foug A]|uniref:Uncharacterized protein n=1 Tax=Scleroderma citrinum Foug A TaxID=1036808 RepID=A0A0C2ZPT6_9AGAM|nr:hypothetical protein SCLCIDRAFT_1221024 [Scleroderma citrinum Foug A]KIM63563.1 hypothetical protein SCLCIDRAFT_1213983 [Scleroderma citrinum Foug A]
MSICAEHHMLDFERSHWEGVDKLAVECREHGEERLRWGTLIMKEKFADWTARHKLN